MDLKLEADEEQPAKDQPLIVAEMATQLERLSVSEAVNLTYQRSDGKIGWTGTNRNAENAKS